MPKLSFGQCMVSKSTLQGAFGRFGMDDARYFNQTCGMERGRWNPDKAGGSRPQQACNRTPDKQIRENLAKHDNLVLSNS